MTHARTLLDAPPMGWSSWYAAFEDILPHSAVSFFGRLSATQAGRYAFAGQIDEWKILKTAAKIVSEGFRDAGYVYINLVLLRMP